MDPRAPAQPTSPRRRLRIGAWSGLTAVAILLPAAISLPGSTTATVPAPTIPPIEEPPVSMPDPMVVADGDGYVMATTQTASGNVPSWTSADLDAWEPGPDLLPTLPSWASPGQTWSPSLRPRSDGTWVLHAATTDAASGVQCILAAESPEVTGPFVPAEEPVVCESDQGGSIDPSVTVIDDVPYLLWATNGPAVGAPMAIRGAPLDADWTGIDGEPTLLLEGADADDPEGTGMVSAPSLVVSPTGELHLLYSTGEWGGPTYALEVVRCQGPLGPCDQDEGAPLAVDGAPSGTAGAKPLLDEGGDLRLALHGPSGDPQEVGVRELVLADASFVEGELALEADP